MKAHKDPGRENMTPRDEKRRAIIKKLDDKRWWLRELAMKHESSYRREYLSRKTK